MKKFIRIVLILLMFAGSFCVSVSADELPDSAEEYSEEVLIEDEADEAFEDDSVEEAVERIPEEEAEGPLSIDDVLTPPEVSISQTSQGLLLECSDSAYLNKIYDIVISDLSVENCIHQVWFRDSYHHFVRSGNTILVPEEYLLEQSLSSDINYVYVYADGYSFLRLNNIVFDVDLLDPPNVSVSQNGNGDLVISSSDSAYMNGLKDDRDFYKNVVSIGGESYVAFNNSDLVFDGNTATISRNLLVENDVENGTHNVSVYSSAYKSKTVAVNFTDCLSEYSGFVEAGYESENGLYIHAQSDFISSIREVSVSCGSFYHPFHVSDGVFRIDGEYLYLDPQVLYAFGLQSGEAYLIIDSDLYYDIHLSEVSIVTSCRQLPEIDVAFDKENGLVVTCYEDDFLSGLSYQPEHQYHYRNNFFGAELRRDSYWEDLYITRTDFDSHQVFLSGSLPDGEFRVNLQSYGYPLAHFDLDLSNGAEGAQAVFDPQRGVVVSSDNESFIEDVYRIELTDKNGVRHYFRDASIYGSPGEFYKEGNEILITNEFLRLRGVPSGNCKVEVYVRYYDGIEIGIIDVISSALSVPSMTVSNVSGTLRISSSDTSFLDLLCRSYSYEDTYGRDIIEVSGETGSQFLYNHDSEEGIYRSGNTVYIDSPTQMRMGVINGASTLYFDVPGYVRSSGYSVNISGGLKKCPSDLRVYVDEADNVVIKTSDTAYLTALTHENVENYSSGYIGVSFSNGGLISNGEYQSDLVVSSDRIIISPQLQKKHRVSNGEQIVYLTAYGYVQESFEVFITDGLEEQYEVDISFVEGTGLVIRSDDEVFINSISIIEMNLAGNPEVSFWFSYSPWDREWQIDGNTLLISEEVLNSRKVPTGFYSDFVIHSEGYDDYYDSSVSVYIATAFRQCPEFEVYFEEGKGLVLEADEEDDLEDFFSTATFISLANEDDRYYDLSAIEVEDNYAFISELDLYDAGFSGSWLRSIQIDHQRVYTDYFRSYSKWAYIPEYEAMDYPSDIFISDNGSGKIFIRSADKKWLSSLCRTVSDFGQRVGIELRNGDRSYQYFGSDLKYNASYSRVEFENKRIANGNYTVSINGSGYKNYETSLSVLSGQKNAPRSLMFTENGNGDITLSGTTSDEKNFIRNISAILLYGPYDEMYGYDSYYYMPPTRGSTTLVIPYSIVRRVFSPAGGTIRFEIMSEGFDYGSYEYAVVKDSRRVVPYFSIYQNSDGHIVIGSSDDDFLENLCHLELDFEGHQSFASIYFDNVTVFKSDHYALFDGYPLYEQAAFLETMDYHCVEVRVRSYGYQRSTKGGITIRPSVFFNAVLPDANYSVSETAQIECSNLKQGETVTYKSLNANASVNTKGLVTFKKQGPVQIEVKTASRTCTINAYAFDKYKITYKLNGSSNAKNNPKVFLLHSGEFALEDPYKKGYDFLGWYDSNGRKVSVLSKGLFRNNPVLELEARFELSEYAIYLDPCGGAPASKQSYDPRLQTDGEFYYGIYDITSATYKLPNLVKDGYKFKGWYDYATDKKVSSISTGSVGDRDLYAIFEPVLYAISYNNLGGKNMAKNTKTDIYYHVNYSVESSVLLLPDEYMMEKKGYRFDGWYLHYDSKTKLYDTLIEDLDDLVMYNGYQKVKLFAKWNIIKYRLYTNYNGGTIIKGEPVPERYDVETKVNLPTLEKRGYKFNGWMDGETGKKLSAISKGTVGIRDIHALFSPIAYKISYNLLSGSMVSASGTYNKTYTIEDEELILPVAKRSGYEFDGWYLNYDKTGKTYSDRITDISQLQELCSNVTLYAKWK